MQTDQARAHIQIAEQSRGQESCNVYIFRKIFEGQLTTPPKLYRSKSYFFEDFYLKTKKNHSVFFKIFEFCTSVRCPTTNMYLHVRIPRDRAVSQDTPPHQSQLKRQQEIFELQYFAWTTTYIIVLLVNIILLLLWWNEPFFYLLFKMKRTQKKNTGYGTDRISFTYSIFNIHNDTLPFRFLSFSTFYLSFYLSFFLTEQLLFRKI